jgi:hypothetical protein
VRGRSAKEKREADGTSSLEVIMWWLWGLWGQIENNTRDNIGSLYIFGFARFFSLRGWAYYLALLSSMI